MFHLQQFCPVATKYNVEQQDVWTTLVRTESKDEAEYLLNRPHPDGRKRKLRVIEQTS